MIIEKVCYRQVAMPCFRLQGRGRREPFKTKKMDIRKQPFKGCFLFFVQRKPRDSRVVQKRLTDEKNLPSP